MRGAESTAALDASAPGGRGTGCRRVEDRFQGCEGLQGGQGAQGRTAGEAGPGGLSGGREAWAGRGRPALGAPGLPAGTDAGRNGAQACAARAAVGVIGGAPGAPGGPGLGAAPGGEASAVRLRPLRPEDHGRFLDWMRDAEVRRHYVGEPGSTDVGEGCFDWVPGAAGREARARVGSPGTSGPAGYLVRSIERADGSLLGWVELRDVNWRRRTGELRICLGDPGTWGCGYGSAALRLFLAQAFGDWGLAGVHLRVATWNVRAVRAYERCGFRREARLRAGRRRQDGLEDLWLMTVVGAARPEARAALR